MKKYILLFLFPCTFLSSCGENSNKKNNLTAMIPIPPAARKIPKKFSEHGHERIDPYYWLAEKENPEVVSYLKAENAYCDSVMAPTVELQKKLYEEMRARIKEEDASVPLLSNGYYYTRETKAGKQYPVYSRMKNAPGSSKEILLDGNALAEGHSTLLLRHYEVSTNNKLLAYLSNYDGSYMEFTLKFLDLDSKKSAQDSIEKVNDFAWANDNKTIFYLVCNDALRPYRVYKHVLGTSPENDKLLFEEKDELFNLAIRKDKTNKYVLVDSESFTSSETRYIPADQPDAPLQVFLPLQKDVKYEVEPHGAFFVVLYQDPQHKNYQVFQAPLANFKDKKSWKEIVPHRTDTKIEDVQAFDAFLAMTIRYNGLPGIRIFDLATGKTTDVAFPEKVFALHTLYNPEYSATTVRYMYSSLNRPETFFDYEIRTNTSTKLKTQEIPSGFTPDDYTVERIFATAADGKKIPVALVCKKGMKMNGKNPLLLMGYGSYGITYDADFNKDVVSLLDRGFIYAIAQIRGGSDLGEDWYDDGKLMKKKNTFTDFIACAEYLIAGKYTSPDFLAIEGRSAGGLLMGAVVNMRPDLFKVVLAGVPFVDVINTMLDASLPLTTQEYEQWGDPNEKEAYEYILSYSPYDNVHKASYPNILASAGYHDSQVGYHEAAKWIARLRGNNTAKDHVLLLQTNMDSGHGGASGRFDYLKEVAFRYAFILSRLGMAG